jgi:hypothetical protein
MIFLRAIEKYFTRRKFLILEIYKKIRNKHDKLEKLSSVCDKVTPSLEVQWSPDLYLMWMVRC